MGVEKIAFYILSALTLGGGVAILFSVRLMRSVVYLLVSLFGVAGLFILMGADFLAALQVLIYVGGITVLLVFGLMLTGPSQFQNQEENRLKAITSGVCSVAIAIVLLLIVRKTQWPTGGVAASETAGGIGRLLLTQNVFAFEIASVLLLVVLVGVALFMRLARSNRS